MKDAVKEMKKMKGFTGLGGAATWAPLLDTSVMPSPYMQVVSMVNQPQSGSSGTKNVAPTAYPSYHPYNLGPMMEEGKKGLLESWKNRLTSYNANPKSGAQGQGVSTAMDARLEFGVELNAEMRLRVGVEHAAGFSGLNGLGM